MFIMFIIVFSSSGRRGRCCSYDQVMAAGPNYARVQEQAFICIFANSQLRSPFTLLSSPMSIYYKPLVQFHTYTTQVFLNHLIMWHCRVLACFYI